MIEREIERDVVSSCFTLITFQSSSHEQNQVDYHESSALHVLYNRKENGFPFLNPLKVLSPFVSPGVHHSLYLVLPVSALSKELQN